MNALETEARTISRMLEAVSGSGSATPVVDAIVVDRGLETALGAALGDGLEAPLDERPRPTGACRRCRSRCPAA